MLRTNLSTRPFYNVRAVRVLIGAAGVLVLAASVFNAASIVQLTLAQRTLGARAFEAERGAARLRAEAAAIRAQINPKELDVVAGAAREANAIIDRRAFSWTDLFAQFEATLPADVRITSVSPRQERDGRVAVAVGVEAKRVEDLDAFMEALEEQGQFHDLLTLREETNLKGFIDAVVEGAYMPGERP